MATHRPAAEPATLDDVVFCLDALRASVDGLAEAVTDAAAKLAAKLKDIDTSIECHS